MPESTTADILPIISTIIGANNARLRPPLESINFRMGIDEEVIRQSIRGFVVEAKRLYRDVNPSMIELVGDLFGGGYRLEQGSLTEQTISEDEKQLSARIQHNQVANILHAGQETASPEYTKAMYSLVSSFESIAQASNNGGLTLFWNGVKGELAVAKAFLTAGYRVFLPDYTQDQYEIEDEENEVLQWDVRHGVDLVAVKGDTVYLVDAKGRMMDDEGMERDAVKVESKGAYNLPGTLNSFIKKLGAVYILRKKIIVPTGSFYMKGLLNKKEATRLVDPNKQQTPDLLRKVMLGSFARLPSYMENDLIAEVESPIYY